MAATIGARNGHAAPLFVRRAAATNGDSPVLPQGIPGAPGVKPGRPAPA